jgi:uncharacterized protein (TIGR02757 family)
VPLRQHADNLEKLYRRYNRRRYVSPDPLEVLYRYDDPADREVAGLVAACLAYGRVAQILRSVNVVLDRLGEAPARRLSDLRAAQLERMFSDFKHRFQTGKELSAMLCGTADVLRREGALERAFLAGAGSDGCDVLGGLEALTSRLDPAKVCGHLLPRPSTGSACKRLHLYLRWMVRRDAVDPGGWHHTKAVSLVVPLDTHMHNIGTRLGAISRRSANFASAQELTAAFRRICPEDPVRYDFSLTRLGIRTDGDLEAFCRSCGVEASP